MSNLPEPAGRHPKRNYRDAYRAAVAPTAVGSAAVGVGIGILANSTVLAVVLGVAGWTGRTVSALWIGRRRQRTKRPLPTPIDPWSVPQPWRQLLEQAAATQSRFQRTVLEWTPGPTRERLESLEPRVYAEVAQLEHLAQRGADATKAGVAGRPGADQLSAELSRIQHEREHRSGREFPRRRDLDRREEAVAAQLRASRRAEAVEAELHDRLRIAVARLDEAVTGLLSLESTAIDTGGVADALEELSAGLLSLREALADDGGPPSGPATS